MAQPTLNDTSDRYPTRTGESGGRIPRTDPSVWGHDVPGPVSPDELQVYDRDGYLSLGQVLAEEEIARCLGEMNLLAADPSLQHDPRLVREHRSGHVQSVYEVHTLSAFVAELVRRESIVGVARQILGSEVYVYQSRINYKSGFVGGPFYWHSDFEVWHAEDGMPAPRACSISIALTPNVLTNGGLMIMPGSHTSFVPCTGEIPADFSGSHKPELSDPPEEALTRLADDHDIRLLTGPAGSATVFDSNCMHGSNGNITPRPRSNLFFVFNSVHNALGEPFAAEGRRPDFYGTRTVVPVEPNYPHQPIAP
ncbi:ectoine hydroxylase [Prauserella marina]|uniref:Ectoine hydroxylase n=1 Tax=Prauserella marina TaxID=530584 RepID=A0A222VRM3_9PSEU|nr:ectoine hydroxylase [Prauserella marina]ASR36540.1 ectoine hydroxylase [Prauserella marina]PWV73936.1 ectoine hydroxylase [Prauserella marina]SDD59328.1 ectoine hydroxylase [Prauserella marina]